MATLRQRGTEWREDPTNADVRYERVRLRRCQAVLADLGLTPESLARSARRLGAERQSALTRVQMIAATQVRDHGGAYGEFVLPAADLRQPADIIRIIAGLIGVFGGTAAPAQLSQIEALTERVLSSSDAAPGRLTLGGCVVDISGADPSRRVVTAFREAGRGQLPTVVLQPGEGCFWDRRFYISLAASASAPVTIMPCPAGVAPPKAAPRGLVAALPAIDSGPAATILFGRVDLPAACEWPMQHAAALKWRDVDDGPIETI
jgi:tRNA(Ile)-lysidine synthase